MLERMDSREYTKWVAFAAIHPFPAERGDYNFARLIAVVVNLLTTKGSYNASDFVVDYIEDARKRFEDSKLSEEELAQREARKLLKQGMGLCIALGAKHLTREEADKLWLTQSAN